MSLCSASGVAGGVCGLGVRRWVEHRSAQQRLQKQRAEMNPARSLLEELCRNRAPGGLSLPGSGATWPLRFDAISESTLAVVLSAPPADPEAIAAPSLVLVLFNYQERARMFMAPVVSVQPGEGGEIRVALSPPAHIASGEIREAFRVEVPESAGVSAVVLHGTRDYVAVVEDMSATGLGLRFPDGLPSGVAVEDEMEVRVSMGTLAAQRTVVVKRIKGDACGVAIVQSRRAEADADEARYVELIRLLIDHQGTEGDP